MTIFLTLQPLEKADIWKEGVVSAKNSVSVELSGAMSSGSCCPNAGGNFFGYQVCSGQDVEGSDDFCVSLTSLMVSQ